MKWIFLCLMVLSGNTLACSALPFAYDWSAKDLAKYASHVGLYKLISIKPYSDLGDVVIYNLQLIEPLRGNFEKPDDLKTIKYMARRHSDVTHFSEDFNSHKDKTFWNKDDGRMACINDRCFCHMNHTFVKGETYLLFPHELSGAKKSAEIIKNKKDQWYQYVIKTEYVVPSVDKLSEIKKSPD